MGYKNLEQQQQAVEAAKYENAKRQTRLHVYQKYLRVVPCDANDKLISDICDRWLGGHTDVLHSLAIFEEAIAENPTEYNMLAKQTVQRELRTVKCGNDAVRTLAVVRQIIQELPDHPKSGDVARVVQCLNARLK